MNSSTKARTGDIPLLHRATKARATALVDSKPATYLPSILCTTCTKAEVPELLQPQGYLIEELQTAITQSDKLCWDLATVEESAAQCPMCQSLLYCLEPCLRADNSKNYEVFIRLEPIAEYMDFGELTFWMMISGQRPQTKRETRIKCQLAVGLKVQQDTANLSQIILHNSSMASESYYEPSASLEDRETDQSSFALPDPADHPSRSADEIGFVSTREAKWMGPPPTCQRELGQNIGPLAQRTIMTNFNEGANALLGFLGDIANSTTLQSSSVEDLTRPGPSQQLPGPPSSAYLPTSMLEKTSSLCIRRLGRSPSGPVDRNSWHYENQNVADSRTINVSDADYDLAKYWLHVCHLWHGPYCPPLVWTAPKSGTFTLRVIDVKRDCIITAPSKCKYAALSYTWGNSKQYKLMKHNFEAMCQPGALRNQATKIPKTITDAILVCQKIDVRYLWVDALCIIQDFPSDKAVQIGSMGYVYGGADVTIVAGCGDSADAGLPGVSFARKNQYFRTKIKDMDLTTAPAKGVDSLLRSAWYTRGWTFQELVLSKRILAFTEEQMLFFCVKGSFREDTLLEAVNGMLHQTNDTMGFFDRHLSTGGNDLRSSNDFEDRFGLTGYASSIRVEQAFDSYWEFLASYLHRKLTNEEDILNAFAGILDALTPYLGTFRWGIPVEYPRRMLSWNFRNSTHLQRRSGAPSWSWAGWKNYSGTLQYHKAQSSRSVLETIDDHDPSGPFFWSFLENGEVVPFEHLHGPSITHRAADWVTSHPVWEHIRANHGRYLLVHTRVVFLPVDQEAERIQGPPMDSDAHAYAIQVGRYKLGRIYLNPNWRRGQPKMLEFIVVAKSMLGFSLMLIERSGPIAYRVQMIDQPVSEFVCVTAGFTLESIVLG